jgi:hypothetical protein
VLPLAISNVLLHDDAGDSGRWSASARRREQPSR